MEKYELDTAPQRLTDPRRWERKREEGPRGRKREGTSSTGRVAVRAAWRERREELRKATVLGEVEAGW